MNSTLPTLTRIPICLALTYTGIGRLLRRVPVLPLMLTCAILICASTMLRAQTAATTPSVFLPVQVRGLSTVPANGDVNPYGVAFVPPGQPHGKLFPGDILVSNFNNSKNLQGTGTTIIRVPQNGPPSLFFQGKAPLGLTTALTVLRNGFVLVGNFPSSDGTCQHSENGSILILNPLGRRVGTIADGSIINGPWDSALFENGSKATLFVANGLTGTVSRLELTTSSSGVTFGKGIVIASGYMHQCDPVTFVDAPTGLVYDHTKDILYVASTLDNAVFAVPNAGSATTDKGRGQVIYQDAKHLHGPLAMTQAPNGHLLVSNNDAVNSDPKQPSEIVEFTVTGRFVKQISVDPLQGGSFGLDVGTFTHSWQLAAVDDNTSLLLIWYIPK